MGNASGNVKAGMVEFVLTIARSLPPSSIINQKFQSSSYQLLRRRGS
jgi:hypothetical protein